MQAIGKFKSASFSVEGGLLVTFEVERDAFYSLDGIKDDTLKIEAVKYREKRTLNANAYFWQLVDKMAKVLKVDKWELYLQQLAKYGVFSDVKIKEEALQTLKKHFRLCEVLEKDGEFLTVRVYFGSSKYNTKEMSDLIEGTVEDAKSLKIETLTPREIFEMLQAWKG